MVKPKISAPVETTVIFEIDQPTTRKEVYDSFLVLLLWLDEVGLDIQDDTIVVTPGDERISFELTLTNTCAKMQLYEEVPVS